MSRRTASAVVVVAATLLVMARAAEPDSGVIRLFFLQAPVGTERYEVRSEGDRRTLDAKFEFADRGGTLPVDATLTTRQDYTPEHFVAKGLTYRYVHVDADVKVDGETAIVRVGTRTQPGVRVPRAFFTLQGFAPFSAQMMLLRYWKAHGQPATIPLLPDGEARIERRGSDTIEVG